jgi:hypothetical protein
MPGEALDRLHVRSAPLAEAPGALRLHQRGRGRLQLHVERGHPAGL